MYHFKKFWFCIVGIICIGVSIRCFTFKESHYVPICIHALSKFEHFGFGSAFLVAGLAFLGGQLPKKNLSEQKDVDNPFDDNVELD